MGMNIILTEAQLTNLEKNVGTSQLNEMRVELSCTYMNYSSLTDFLGEKEAKKLGHNTIVHMVKVMDSPEDQVAVKYHGTNIIKIDSNNIVTLDTGGWETNTTKDRLNQFLSCRDMGIYQKKGKWYIRNRFGDFPYEDGMKVLPDGQIIGIDNIDPRKIPTYIKQMKSLDIDPKYKELYGISDEKPSKN